MNIYKGMCKVDYLTIIELQNIFMYVINCYDVSTITFLIPTKPHMKSFLHVEKRPDRRRSRYSFFVF